MKFRTTFSRVAVQVFLIAVSITCIFPIIWMVSTSLKTRSEVYMSKSLIPKVLQFKNYAFAWTHGINTYFFNSLLYVIIVVTAVVIVSSLAAFAFSKLEFPFKKAILGIFIASIMIPVPGNFVPMYILLVKLRINNTRLGYMLPLVAGSLAVAIFILKAFFDGIPRQIEESAKMDGCRKLAIYARIIMPLSTPAIATIVIFNVLGVWNEYLLATVILNNDKIMPLQRGISVFVGQRFTQYELYMAASAIAIAPIILLYIILNGQVLKGVTTGAIKE